MDDFVDEFYYEKGNPEFAEQTKPKSRGLLGPSPPARRLFHGLFIRGPFGGFQYNFLDLLALG